jgi:putative sigma-54 modulation protein
MLVQVTYKHFEPAQSLTQYAEQKIEKIKKYLTEPIDVRFVLTVEKFRQIASVTITANGHVFKIEESSEDMYSSIDKLIGRVETQLRRRKEKVKNHKSKKATAE